MEEDFTFPKTKQPSQIDSSSSSAPLWHVISSSSSSTNPPHSAASQSSSSSKFCDMADHHSERSLDEEKMDMLWEDFNEELRFQRDPSPNSHPSLDFSKEMVHFGCTSVIKSRRKGSNESPAVSFLKKLFLLHNSHLSGSKRRLRH